MPKTLLLADDSVVIQKLVGLSFANEDIELVTTDNGDEALTRAREVAPDLILADVVMPGKNGYEVCAAIKSDPQLSHVPVLLLTGTFEAFDEERARQVGSDGHVTKPFEAQGLVDRVTELLARAPQAGPATGQAAAAPAAPQPAASATPQAPPSAPARPPQVGAAPPAASGDDAYDFFDDDVQQLAAADEPTMTVATPASASAPAPGGPDIDPLSSLANDPLAIDGLGESNTLDTGFDLEPSAPDDLTRVVMSPAPGPGGPPPVPDELGATRVALDEDPLAMPSAGVEPPAGPSQQMPPARGERQAEAMGTSTAAGDPMLADDLFANSLATPNASLPQAEPSTEATPPPVREQPPTDVPVTTGSSPPAAPRIDVSLDSPAPAAANAATLEAAFERGSEQPAPAAPTPAAAPLDAPAEPPKSDFDVSISDLGDPFASASPTAGPGGERPGVASRAGGPSGLDASPEMRDRIHETLEKVAWEAFADLSDTIVRKVIQRVESVVWDIVPQMAETLIQEEIRRMKGES